MVPSTATLDRIVRAAGFTIDVTLTSRAAPAAERGEELEAVLRLAAQFPTRHRNHLELPVFGRAHGT